MKRTYPQRGQISMETMAGFGIFLILFIGISSVIFSENNYLDAQSQDIVKEKYCLQIAQALYETKNETVTWSGSIDYNTHIAGNTIYVDYSPSIPFQGIYCETLDTNLSTTLTQGDANISYVLGRGYTITQ